MNFGLLTLFDYYPEDCSPQEYYRFLLDEIAYAEDLGFDSVWMGEHHFCNYLCPSPQVFAAAVAQRTKRLRLGTAVALLPLHDPVRLAEDYAMVDVLSDGRLDFGVSRGFQKTSYDGFERSMDDSRERFAEGIEIIDKAWSQDSISYEGQYRRLSNVSVLPRPVQRPRPPIWIGAGPTPESYELAAAHGYNILLASVFAPIKTFTPFVKLYRERLQAAGFDPAQMSTSTGNHCYVGTSSAQAKEVWAKHYLRYFHFVSTLVEEKDYQQNKQFKAFAGVKTFLEKVDFDKARQTLAICGDAEECIDRVAQAKEAVGNTHYWVYSDLGGLPREEVWASLRRFAEKVMPKFR
ncbi:MAG: LLM class flavin-dependent oxidoreductase [Deltaproteobacteria bacterium]|nr:LLM class flavin-dependent oxidoreductase [Deltaproteobacteria bacterium]